jgi:nucleoside-diphosphate-sugar epimerase
MKNVVISGGTGMIGIALIRKLITEDVEHIYVLCRESSLKIDRLPADDRICITPCSISEFHTLPDKIPSKCDTFYHFAWLGTGGARRNLLIDQQAENIKYTMDAIEVAQKLGCSKFIGAGSQAEFGLLDVDKIRPDSPCNPIQAYGIAKYAAGRLAMLKAEMLEIDCLWVRIFSVYGTLDRRNSLISTTIEKLRKGEKPPFTPAQQKWDYLFEQDAGDAFAAIGEKASGRKVYCLGSGESKRLQEYIEIIRDCLDPNLQLGIGDLPYPPNAVMNLCADISAITEDTGWVPKISFETGIVSTINNFS